MKTVIYVGNKLSSKGLNPTTIDHLSKKFESSFTVYTASSKSSTILRLIDIWFTVLFKHYKADYLLIDTYSYKAFTYAWTAGKLALLLRLPYIPYLHGGDLPKRYDRSKKLCSNYLSNAVSIVSPSFFLKHETEKRFNVKVDVIPNYLNISEYSFKKRTNINPLRILWVRAFQKIYNPFLMISVLKNLLNKNVTDIEIVMIGSDKDGSLEKMKEKLKNENLDKYFRFTGKLDKAEWIKLSENSNLFVNTTNADNTPLSVMESMALGFPVITTNAGGIPYLFEDGKEGIMVEVNDSEKMAMEIIDLLDNPKKVASISDNARKKAESWDWESVQKKWLRLLNYE